MALFYCLEVSGKGFGIMLGRVILAIAIALWWGLWVIWAAPQSQFLTIAKTVATPWNYADLGPQRWGELQPEFQTCAVGETQSPLALFPESSTPVSGASLPWQYQPSFGLIRATSTTLQIQVTGNNTLQLGADRYKLEQIHFHYPSEHHVQGKQYAMEVHFVHRRAPQGVAVLAVLVESGTMNPTFAHILQRWPTQTHPSQVIHFDPAALLPQGDRPYFRYVGSLTTPPCTEGISWLVVAQPIFLGATQIKHYQALYAPNARPLQTMTTHQVQYYVPGQKMEI
ncbi:carbonic anhydrase [Picosynechococcus sp. PCC 11901]|uniref:carbonic anhydrase n=2 Tax=Picosynechococcus sp. PCC 11901 TaxID=2579791 RepID=UPI00143DAA51|nr:carbonic anhydrase family protein [Picosynechococcus sp. PCC 11901]